jgi:hypothetical protein
MYITTSIFAALILCPLAVLSQATTTSVDISQQTIVPFSTLPACAAKCGPLYDAQGACSPPIVAATSLTCFCSYATLQAFYTSTAGVCDGACPSDPSGLTQIQQWFIGLCNNKGTSQTTATGSSPTTTSTDTGTAVPGNSAGSDTSSGSSNQTWYDLSTNLQRII